MAQTLIRHAASTRSTNPETSHSTGLNSLADGSGVLGGALGNSDATELDLLCDLELVLASLTPAADAYVECYLVPSIDDANFGDTPGIHVGNFRIETGTGAKRAFLLNVEVPPKDHKFYLVNQTGVALASSGNTLRALYHNGGSGA